MLELVWEEGECFPSGVNIIKIPVCMLAHDPPSLQ